MKQEKEEAAQGSDELGAVIRVFRPRRWWIGLTICALTLAALIPLTIHVKLIANRGAIVVPLAVAAAASGGGVALFGSMLLLSLNRRVLICENGVLVRGLLRTRTALWENIDSVYFHMSKLILGQEASLKTRQGEKIRLPGMIVGLFAAFNLICDRITPQVLADLREKLGSDQVVPFGKHLSVTREGLLWKGNLLRWSDIGPLAWGVEHDAAGNMFAVRSVLAVQSPTGSERLLTKGIPNLPILLDWIESAHGIQVERATKLLE